MTSNVKLPKPATGYGRGRNIELADGQPLYTIEQVHACIALHTAVMDAEIERLRAEVERLQEVVRPKREDECLTLDHWRMRAYDLEENWSRCSRACTGEQTKREQAEARAERLAEAINAYKSECVKPDILYVLRAKRRDEMFDLLREQEVDNV